jgi:hypothetical protein
MPSHRLQLRAIGVAMLLRETHASRVLLQPLKLRATGSVATGQTSTFCVPQYAVRMYLIRFLTLLCAGLLAGFEVAVHYGFGSPPRSLNDAAQILLRQAMILRLRILAPVLFIPTLLLGICLTIQEAHRASVAFDSCALALLGVWIVIRILRTVPVNSATLGWNAEDPPLEWRERIERTERFHVVAAWAAVLAFMCFLVPALRYR